MESVQSASLISKAAVGAMVKKPGKSSIDPVKPLDAADINAPAVNVNKIEIEKDSDNKTENQIDSLTSSLAEKSEAAKKEEPVASVPKTEKEEAESSIGTVNDIMDTLNKGLKFVSDERLEDELVVQVIEKDSGKVLKQIPSEEIIELRDKLESSGIGALLDNSA